MGCEVKEFVAEDGRNVTLLLGPAESLIVGALTIQFHAARFIQDPPVRGCIGEPNNTRLKLELIENRSIAVDRPSVGLAVHQSEFRR